MDVVKFGRKWEINSKEDYDLAMKTLAGNEFVANMSDDFRCYQTERAEVQAQRVDVIRQARAKGIITEG